MSGPRLVDDTIHFPLGSGFGPLLRDEEGGHVLGLYPTAAPSKADIARWDNDLLWEVTTFEFSRGNSWPDTVSMIANVEERLSRGWPVLFCFSKAPMTLPPVGTVCAAGVLPCRPSRPDRVASLLRKRVFCSVWPPDAARVIAKLSRALCKGAQDRQDDR